MAAATTADAPAGESSSPVTIVCVGMAGEKDFLFLLCRLVSRATSMLRHGTLGSIIINRQRILPNREADMFDQL